MSTLKLIVLVIVLVKVVYQIIRCTAPIALGCKDLAVSFRICGAVCFSATFWAYEAVSGWGVEYFAKVELMYLRSAINNIFLFVQ